MKHSDIITVHRPTEGKALLSKLEKLSPIFSLVVAYTATVQLPGLSGAGTTPELRELTASADAEILYYGKAHCLESGVPSNPTGAPGPSIITRAAFNLLPNMPYVCIDAGLKISADVPGIIKVDGAMPANAVNTGFSLPLATVNKLFLGGLYIGQKLAEQYGPNSYLIIAESVAGGTTTALGLLLGLGVDAEEKVSSSMPNNAHPGKLEAVEAGLKAVGAVKGSFAEQPLEAVASMGDPMSAVAAGMALAASNIIPVVLGGGTQMAAVVALIAALLKSPPPEYSSVIVEAKPANIALATTRWVSADPTADLAGLAAEIESKFGKLPIPYFAANLNFAQSKYLPMRLYEEGFVKEGVGAGAAALAAILNGTFSSEELLEAIEEVYRTLVLG